MGKQGRGGNKPPKKKAGKLKEMTESDEIAAIRAREVEKIARTKAAQAKMIHDKKDPEGAEARAKCSANLVATLARSKVVTGESEAKRKVAVEAEVKGDSKQTDDVVMITKCQEAKANKENTKQNKHMVMITDEHDKASLIETQEEKQRDFLLLPDDQASSTYEHQHLVPQATTRYSPVFDCGGDALARPALK